MLKTRVVKARAAAMFAATTLDKDGRVKSVTLPGSNGKLYRVFLKRIEGHGIIADCGVDAGSYGRTPCKGNAQHTCYHAIAAAIVAAEAAGGHISFAETPQAAARLARLGGEVVTIVGGGHPVYGVYTKEGNEKKEAEDTFKEEQKKRDEAILKQEKRKSRMYK